MNGRKMIWATGLALLAASTAVKSQPKAEALYAKHCASCHGEQLAGGMAPSLLDDQWFTSGEPGALAEAVRDGIADRGMPAFGESLSPEQIRSLVIYIGEQRYQKARAMVQSPAGAGELNALGYRVQLDTLFETDGVLWALDQLPDRSWLVTRRDGALLHLSSEGELLAQVKGLPKAWVHAQGGLLDVTVHPDYARNGWIYLALAYAPDGKAGSTRVVRGRLKDYQWVDEQTIYQVPAAHQTGSGYHFGSRVVVQDGYVFFSIGDRGDKETAQQLSSPNGKVMRLHEDGRVPADNPFVNTPGALPEIWSYGHRNPQGMAIEPATGALWLSEHGPRGGDEINRVARGVNYGWPVITYGMNYNGTPITHLTAQPGMAQPKHYWVPSIAVSGIEFYQGELFAQWQNQLLVGGLAKQVVELLTVEGEGITGNALLLADQGRIRDLAQGADGALYLLATVDGRGRLLRLTPAR